MNYPPGLDVLFKQGKVGVSFFFVLSGFIMVYNYYAWFKHDTKRFKDFGRARFARVFPMYVLALLLVTPFYEAGFALILWNKL